MRLHAATRPPTSPISSLLVAKKIVSLVRDATKTTAEMRGSEAVDTRVESAGVMKSLPGEVLHRLWRTAEILVVATTGGAGMTVTAGTVDATDVLEEKTITLDAHCRMCKAHSAAVVQSKASRHLRPRRLARHLHQNGSVAHHVATTNLLTTDAAVAVVEAATSEAQGVKTIAMVEAVDPAARMISCSRRERTVGNAGTRTGLEVRHQGTSTRRGDAVGGRWMRTSWLVETDLISPKTEGFRRFRLLLYCDTLRLFGHSDGVSNLFLFLTLFVHHNLAIGCMESIRSKIFGHTSLTR